MLIKNILLNQKANTKAVPEVKAKSRPKAKLIPTAKAVPEVKAKGRPKAKLLPTAKPIAKRMPFALRERLLRSNFMAQVQICLAQSTSPAELIGKVNLINTNNQV